MSLVSTKNSLEGYIPFLPDEIVALLANTGHAGSGPFPRGVAELIASYTNDILFGVEHWRAFWNAIPVSLPSIHDLRARATHLVVDTGKNPPKPVEKMSAEECANFVGEQGKEENPEPPLELRAQLNAPVRQGEARAAFTCGVMFIPEFVRRDGRILAVNCRNLGLKLGPKPVQGKAAWLYRPADSLNKTLKEKDVETTQASCFFVMELKMAPGTQDMAIDEAREQLSLGWAAPDVRNCMAMIFSLYAWKGVCLFGDVMTQPSGTYVEETSRGGEPLIMGVQNEGLAIFTTDSNCNVSFSGNGMVGSRKFPVQVSAQAEDPSWE